MGLGPYDYIEILIENGYTKKEIIEAVNEFEVIKDE